MAEKSLRLSQLAKECNTGVATLIEFLQSNGVEEKLRPTSRIDGEFIQLALDKFAPDMAKKEQSEKVSQQKKEEKEKLKAELEGKDEVSKPASEVIKARSSLSGPKMVGKIDLDKPTKTAEEVAPAPEAEKPEAKPEPVKAEEVKEVPEKETVAETPKEVEAPKEQKEEPKQESPKPAKADEKKEEVKAAEEKVEEPKPEKKEAPKAVEEKAAEEKVEAPKTEDKPKVEEAKTEKAEVKEEPKAKAEEEKPKAAEETKVSEEAKADASTPAGKVTDDEGNERTVDAHKTQYTKLSGPKFTGEKVDLSKFAKPKKKVASSTDKKGDNKAKPKRKRIRTNPGVGAGGPGAGGQNRPGQFKKGGNRGPGGGRRNEPKRELTEEEVQKQIKETLEKLTGGGKKSKSAKMRREKRQERKEQDALDELQREEDSKTIQVTEFVTVSELANMMDVSVNEIISACMSLGMMVTMNQRLDGETLQIVAEEFGYGVEFVSADVTEAIEEEVDQEEDLSPRAPIVTVMGHVDHGKTSLLDYVRKANVIAGESGGITQHIGAYSVELEQGGMMTFLDTPGHEAFTAMRARGAQVTDIAIIVIAADDDVMPQTKEAISHAQAAGVPIVFAINKIDRPGANPEKVKETLAQMNLLVEDWGGKIQSQDISAKSGQGVNELLEKVLLESELLDLKANPDRNAAGSVVEASLDKGRGYLSTILVQNGTLKIGDYILAGQYSGKVKAMLDERGHRVEEAGPARPVSVLGLDGAPQAGDKFVVMDDEREAKSIASKRTQLQREQSARSQKNLTLEEIGRRLAIGDFQELNVIVKGDVDGSIEALSDSLQKLSTDEIQVNIIHKAVGQISESDILLATASDAIIVGFQVRPSASARKLAEKEQVDVRLYSIIYDAINEIRDAMEGMLSPEVKEKVVCNIEIRETFKISKVGTIAGCYVLDGTVTRNTKIRVIRDGVVVYTGVLGSLKRYKDDVKEVSKGYECGLNVQNFNDIKVGDNIEGFEEVEVKKTL
ncbi:translation initiation factor IF-2 [Owenweeksia hongkongensis]|uniref:translation initiation factor IF-2 n=1 Tax=Owenweeksia hongkongensis TaxID=253245 RepID=UPI003A8E07BD